MPTKNRSNNADGWIACDDGLHLIQMDKNLSHYGWVFRKVNGGLPYSVREATSHEMAHAQARQHLRIGVAQIAGQAPAPQPHPEPIAWMVGTAFWWTKEEAERDAAATGLTMTPVGPITEIGKPAGQQQGEPAAWVRFRNGEPDYDGEAVMIMNVPGDTLGDGDSWVPVYTHADPGEVERLRIELSAVNFNLDKTDKGLLAADAEVRKLRAQMDERNAALECMTTTATSYKSELAKRDALLREVIQIAEDREQGYADRQHGGVVNGKAADSLVMLMGRMKLAVSSGAEPSAAVEHQP